MLTFLKKDLLLFWRDRKELLIVITLPLLIIVVLSFALSGLFGEDQSENYDLSLSVVIEDNENEALEEFISSVNQSQELPEDVKEALTTGVREAPPVESLIQFLMSPDMESWMTVETMSESAARESVENESKNAMLVIPEGYTTSLLNRIYFEQEAETALEFSAKDTAFEVDMIQSIIQGFVDQMNLQYVISSAGGTIDPAEVQMPVGGIETLEEEQSSSLTIGIDQYFTISMGVLFVLFLASTIASRTGSEKREHTFSRVILSNAPPLHFLFGKTSSTFILAFLQILIIFIGSHLILGSFADRSLTFWFGTILILLVYSFSIAGLTSILTSISLQIKNQDVVDGLFMGIIMLFGTIGGSFVPIYVMPQWLRQIGEFTPNGQTLAVLMEWFQYENFSALWVPLLILAGLSAAAIMGSILLYPKKGETS
ncbi:ABC transporter permease [Jeotgalibacillus proteolyticus]|uniref:ABC transporter permease n=1 Tax=Jeotgalibacillus proteolyticus TaxID=2082395 RepID=A0A2S5G800_9BACL|nr:ABC transporter permease [Jeotgalibacillus proteolyticus]PPA69110.1 ABC transporter permease [Jeotgalibacillus proteolyticus]